MAENKVTIDELQKELEKEKSARRTLQSSNEYLMERIEKLESDNLSLLGIVDNLSVVIRRGSYEGQRRNY